MKNKLFASILLMSVVLSIVKTSVAQNTSFKLSEYKNPNYLYQSLDFNFGLNSGLGGFKNTSFDTYSSNDFSFSTQGGAAYTRYLNTPKAQSDLQISFNAGVGSGNSNSKNTVYENNWNNNTKSFSHWEGLNIAGVKRFYNPKQSYLEVNGSLSLSNSGNSNTYESYLSDTISSSEDSGGKRFSNAITGSLLIGKGRIEQVQDARLALYILDDLFKLNREKRTITDDDVNALAQLITALKYTRYYDSRLQNIANIIAIDSLLQKNGIVSNPDAAYFTSLNDNWQYANNPVRYSGHRFFTGLEANFSYTYRNEYKVIIIPDNLTDEATIKYKAPGLFLVLGYTYEKPTSLKWQNSASVKGSIGIKQYNQNIILRKDPTPETETELYTEAWPSVKLAAEYGFGYYPNSRTWMEFNWALTSGWDKKMEGTTKADKEDSQNQFYTQTGPQLNAYYYLSAKLRLSFYYHGYLNYDNKKYTMDIPEGANDTETRTNWGQTVNAALTYSLF
jgi:hypothetical protein